MPDAAQRYRRAIELGVDYVELDVRRTANGTYAVYHDGVTPSGRAVRSLDYSELRAELGAEVLELDELFDIVGRSAGLHIDLKEVGYEAQIVRAALARVEQGGFVVTSLEDQSIETIKRDFPHVRAGLSLGRDLDRAPLWRRLGVRISELFPASRLARCHADFAAAHQRLARIRVLRDCARRHMPVWVWTVDEEAELSWFLDDPRVEVLVTNRPDVALRMRTERRQNRPR